MLTNRKGKLKGQCRSFQTLEAEGKVSVAAWRPNSVFPLHLSRLSNWKSNMSKPSLNQGHLDLANFILV